MTLLRKQCDIVRSDFIFHQLILIFELIILFYLKRVRSYEWNKNKNLITKRKIYFEIHIWNWYTSRWKIINFNSIFTNTRTDTRTQHIVRPLYWLHLFPYNRRTSVLQVPSSVEDWKPSWFCGPPLAAASSVSLPQVFLSSYFSL